MVSIDRLIAELEARRGLGLPAGGKLIDWPGKKPSLAYAASSTTRGRIELPADTAGVALVTTTGFNSLQLSGESSSFSYLNLGVIAQGQMFTAPWGGAFDRWADFVIMTGAGQVGQAFLTAFPNFVPPSANAAPPPQVQFNRNRGAGGAALTITLAAAGAGLFHYVTKIRFTKFAGALLAASAAGVSTTSTNLGGYSLLMDTAADAVGTIQEEVDLFIPPLRSDVANTATTVTGPVVASVNWEIGVWYYVAP